MKITELLETLEFNLKDKYNKELKNLDSSIENILKYCDEFESRISKLEKAEKWCFINWLKKRR